jgi:hypothetical protein
MKHLALILFACAAPLPAAELLLNGGFELNFTSWTRVDQAGSDGTFAIQTGTFSPVNGDTVPAPPGPTRAAMSDSGAPGSHLLYQDFLVPSAPQFLLSLDLFLGNRGGLYASPASLDFGINGFNQQFRLDIVTTGAAPFSLAAADVLANLYQTQPGNPLVSGYNHLSFDVSSLLNSRVGQTVRLRFAEVDNQGAFQVGVDNVSLQSGAVPEPGTMLLTAGACLLGLARFGKIVRCRMSRSSD